MTTSAATYLTNPSIAIDLPGNASDPFDDFWMIKGLLALDIHDHSPGFGKQIPTAGIEDLAITTGKIALEAVDEAQLAEGAVTGIKIAPGSIDSAKLADTLLALLNPTGTLMAFAGANAPTGWLMAQGQAVSRTTYAALFSAIGTTYGVGDGSTTFNLPNGKGRALVGLDTAQTEFDALGKTGGEKAHALTIAEMPSHTHTTDSQGSHQHTINGGSDWNPNSNGFAQNKGDYADRVTTNTAGAHTHTALASGNGGAHNNLQPYITMNYIIKT